jgi:hypothetical protein
MTRLSDDLPEALLSVRTRPLFVLRLNVGAIHSVGGAEGPPQRVATVPSGVFEGERLSGVVLDGGSDWQMVRGDGTTALDVRLVLKTDDGAVIGMTYTGIRHGPPDVMARIAKGEAVDPADYYFRTNASFTTSDARYDWLNRILAIGTGHRIPTGPVYNLFELL